MEPPGRATRDAAAVLQEEIRSPVEGEARRGVTVTQNSKPCSLGLKPKR
jgi:hypothetical protein